MVAWYGRSISSHFNQILEQAFPDIGVFNAVVRIERPPFYTNSEPFTSEDGPKPDEDGDFEEIDRKNVLRCISVQAARTPGNLEKWIEILLKRFEKESVLLEKLNTQVEYLRKEQSKRALWIIDDNDDINSAWNDSFFEKVNLRFEIAKKYRLDIFEGISKRTASVGFDTERGDFNYAGCILIYCREGLDGAAGSVIRNVFDLALDAANEGREAPKIVVVASSEDQIKTIIDEIESRWKAYGKRPPFLFLFRTEDKGAISPQQDQVVKFFLSDETAIEIIRPGGQPVNIEIPPPPPPRSSDTRQNDLVVVVGGRITSDGDVARFNALKKALGQDGALVIIDPWADDGQGLTMHAELRAKFDAAKSPLLVEHVGENDPEDEATVFQDYLQLCSFKPLALMKSMVARASKQRLIWKPDVTGARRPDGVEVHTEPSEDFALLLRRRLGLEDEDAGPKAFVAVEEVILDGKLDSKLRKALKKHLSILVGGTGVPPTDECVVPFSFQVAGASDPLYEAALNFKKSQTNIVAACDLNRGASRLEDYLTGITARVRDGIDKGFRGKEDQPGYVLHILVMIDGKRLDTELTDGANGNWRVVKFLRESGEYQPDTVGFQSAQAWMKTQLDFEATAPSQGRQQ